MEAPAMRRATIFVLSDNRSGSTLLDQCLGGHPQIVSLGEVHWLDAYLAQDRAIYDPAHDLLCTCGKAVTECPFWTSVERALGRPLGSLALRQRFTRSRRGNPTLNAIKHVPRRIVKNHARLYRFQCVRNVFGGSRLARDCMDLYDAVSAVTGRPFCVDSSKTPHRFRDVYAQDPARTVAIVLCRDYRAVVHSKMKRGLALALAASGWRLRMQQIRALTDDLPESRVFRVAYESFCAAPERELARLSDFLRIGFDRAMLQRAAVGMHHIGGSPSKFDPGRIHIAIDRSHENQFSPAQLAEMHRIVGKEAVRWGY
jgi:hypothetical protein